MDADGRLTQNYELVVLDQTADGELELSTLGLFFPGAGPGDRKRFRIRCAPGPQEHGTAFVLVESERAHDFAIMSVQSANVPPGTYSLTAELTGPSAVTIHGLPSPLHEDGRSWDDIAEATPDRVERLGPRHLIVAVEFSGEPDHVRDRLDRARWLIRRVQEGADDELRVSLLTYGPHKVLRTELEQPPRLLTWAESGEAALGELALLGEQEYPPLGYWRAAQLECLLTMLAGRVKPDGSRVVLVTIGSRPAFPPELDAVSQIIPCRNRRDWREPVETLTKRGVTFGAIRDHDENDEIWYALGHSALARLSTVELRRFAIDLDLIVDTFQTIPLPLKVKEGA
jgi:hypothetical protein